MLPDEENRYSHRAIDERALPATVSFVRNLALTEAPIAVVTFINAQLATRSRSPDVLPLYRQQLCPLRDAAACQVAREELERVARTLAAHTPLERREVGPADDGGRFFLEYLRQFVECFPGDPHFRDLFEEQRRRVERWQGDIQG